MQVDGWCDRSSQSNDRLKFYLMSIEKNFEKEKNRNLFYKKFFFPNFFGQFFLRKAGLVGALALYLSSKNCFPQHLNFVRNSFFYF